MKKFSTKGVSEHTRDGTLGFVSDSQALAWDCNQVQATLDVVSTAVVEITGITFRNCTAAGGAAGTDCTVTATGTNFPWTATARTTNDIQIHGVNIDITFEQPLGGGATCGAAAGQRFQVTGTLTGGRWTGNATHEIDFPNSGAGLVSHSALGLNSPITPTGTQQTLTVTN